MSAKMHRKEGCIVVIDAEAVSLTQSELRGDQRERDEHYRGHLSRKKLESATADSIS
jgi:ribosomal protein L13